jgi:hypothetical protein
MPENSSADDASQLLHALAQLESVLDLLERASAPTGISAYVDAAISRLHEEIEFRRKPPRLTLE